ncbi:MAG: metal-dependent hydrolase [Saprospiraceae bacterium]|nr:MAG: metal-dependent hydrolase [Bacteroidetes bacterium OLB9]MCO6463697.1 metal-dependent hydrolase [Saprospiraceae bacterium]MCZ2339059.1 metal-dependent hydrolase [Chitinophagales bacterium]
MTLRYLGQSSFQAEFGGKHLVFDPMIKANELARDIDIDTIKADYVLLSHGHSDHVEDAEHIAKNNNATLISNFEIVSWYQDRGLKGHPMNLGGKFSFDFGTVKYVNAIHSSMLPDGSYGGASGGFVIWNNEKRFYFAGDTALTMDLKLIPMTCPKLDFAILPIGDNFTMGYDDAVLAAEFIQCDKIIACHFDTFGYIKIDHEAAKAAFKKEGKELIILSVGESIQL